MWRAMLVICLAMLISRPQDQLLCSSIPFTLLKKIKFRKKDRPKAGTCAVPCAYHTRNKTKRRSKHMDTTLSEDSNVLFFIYYNNNISFIWLSVLMGCWHVIGSRWTHCFHPLQSLAQGNFFQYYLIFFWAHTWWGHHQSKHAWLKYLSDV